MDINTLFQEAMFECGRVLKILPKDEIGSPKQYMNKVLELKTMPSINHLFPHILRMVVHVEDLIPLGSDGQYCGFRIPLELTGGLEIQSIKSLYTGSGIADASLTGGFTGGYNGYMGTSLRLSAYPNKYGRYSSANLYETVLTANMAYADLQLLGAVTEAPIPRFESPNIMYINKSYATSPCFAITFCTNNDKNLLTLDNKAYEGTRRLFMLDLKSAIYGEYGILSSIETPMGTLDLKIEEWSGASEQRNELFDTYDSLSHLRKNAIIAG